MASNWIGTVALCLKENRTLLFGKRLTIVSSIRVGISFNAARIVLLFLVFVDLKGRKIRPRSNLLFEPKNSLTNV